MIDTIVHSYEGRYAWEVGREVITRVVPSDYNLSRINPNVPALSVQYQTWYTKDGAYVGNVRGGAIRYGADGKPINPEEYGLVLKTVNLRTIPYPQGDPKRYDPLQPMRDNYEAYKSGGTSDGFLTYEIQSLLNLARDYYAELEANANALGIELKAATQADTIGVLMSTFGSKAGAIGALVSAAGWIVQALSGKGKLTEELKTTMEKAQKDLAEISAIYNVYVPAKNSSIWVVSALAIGAAVIIKKRKK